MSKFLKEATRFGKEHQCQIKRAGDGFTAIMEFKARHKKKDVHIYEFLLSIKVLTKRVMWLVKNCPWPAPEGFRIRVTAGWVDVHVLEDGPEYIGEAPNLARDLLYVDPGVEIILHSSVIKKLTAAQQKELNVSKLTVKEVTKEIMEIQDTEIKELWGIPL